ncbi:hypothetical protein HAQ01_05240 [Acidithiobacillus thiooxidans]|uniref:hypothetical protein n=1 Tax=Acidithiobacillus thiooxidans TaxID=930 RepID=UPI001C06E949|nr:hypothetical protein [Acidithiobacillus thiooxidans]MBU2792798.1 hypothetical protein [Acidithiobacillus thiooxidans]
MRTLSDSVFNPSTLPAKRSPQILLDALDEIVSSTMDQRCNARKQARQTSSAKTMDVQTKNTRALIHDATASRDAQNAAIAKLVALCGSENRAARLLGKAKHFVQVRVFEASEVFADLRGLWPNTESSVLMSLVAKAKRHPQRFEQYMRPFLNSRVRQQILRSEFAAAWSLAMNDGVLPADRVLSEKREAEEIADMALNETAAMESELKSIREARAILEAKVAALESALEHANLAPDTAGVLTDELVQDMENLLRGKYTPSLKGLLCYAEHMFADRVLILPSAWKSAAESDKAGFSPVEPVADLLFKLARECVDQYRQGGHFLPGTILGSAYADSEGHSPMTEGGFKRRTFSYNGKMVPMMPHLKIGTGWNKGTTFRAHFCYDTEIGKVVIGHFGKHLDR